MGNSLKKEHIDSRTGLSDKEKKAVRDSWFQFCLRYPDHGSIVFMTMFIHNPEYMDLFRNFKGKRLAQLHDDPKFRAHASAVGHQFSAIVDTVDDTVVLVELMRKNAVNHVPRSGVQPMHFESICQAVMEVLHDRVAARMNRAAVSGWVKLTEVSGILCFMTNVTLTWFSLHASRARSGAQVSCILRAYLFFDYIFDQSSSEAKFVPFIVFILASAAPKSQT